MERKWQHNSIAEPSNNLLYCKEHIHIPYTNKLREQNPMTSILAYNTNLNKKSNLFSNPEIPVLPKPNNANPKPQSNAKTINSNWSKNQPFLKPRNNIPINVLISNQSEIESLIIEYVCKFKFTIGRKQLTSIKQTTPPNRKHETWEKNPP